MTIKDKIFKAFFTQDATEQDKAFKTFLPTYQKTFSNIKELKYEIDMTSFSKDRDSNKILIKSNCTAQYRLQNKKKWGRSHGSIWMELLETPDALLVRRLNYKIQR